MGLSTYTTRSGTRVTWLTALETLNAEPKLMDQQIWTLKSPSFEGSKIHIHMSQPIYGTSGKVISSTGQPFTKKNTSPLSFGQSPGTGQGVFDADWKRSWRDDARGLWMIKTDDKIDTKWITPTSKMDENGWCWVKSCKCWGQPDTDAAFIYYTMHLVSWNQKCQTWNSRMLKVILAFNRTGNQNWPQPRKYCWWFRNRIEFSKCLRHDGFHEI